MSKRPSREGTQIPDVELAELRDGMVKRISKDELFKGRRVVLFALPGAFTHLQYGPCSRLCRPAQGFSRRRYRRCGLSLGERSVRHGSVATLIEVLMAG
jgi:peroxiredoxin